MQMGGSLGAVLLGGVYFGTLGFQPHAADYTRSFSFALAVSLVILGANALLSLGFGKKRF